ncbi:hypothetical protein DH2020_008322 [Rehmannia glutinosa]|uniref:Uncharacterized protein n=1 Tax=Rehmannia glutinosa TaxID=99300 RepID=A0ABR0U0P9_REHGL
MVAEDKWIGSPKPDGIKGNHTKIPTGLKVRDLIDMEGGIWRHSYIKQIFEKIDADRILSMHISRRFPPDKYIWIHSKSGLFTVKSAYYWIKAREDQNHLPIASSSDQNTAWKQMWNLRVIPKVKHFLWRTCTESLPTKSGLLRRGLQIDPICELCGETIESTTHLFLECRSTLPVWYLSTLRLDLHGQQFGSFKNFLWTMLQCQPIEYIEMLGIIAWRIWLARNKWCMEKKRFDVMKIINEAQRMTLEMYHTRQPPRKDAKERKRPQWIPPPPGTLKVNTDVAVFHDGTVGYGFVIRDNAGAVSLAGARREQKQGSSTILEGIAMLFAIEKALEAGFTGFQVESDSKCLIEGLQGKRKPEATWNVILEDVTQYANMAQCTNFIYVNREANQLAHALAHFPKDVDVNLVWCNEVPSSIEGLRIDDRTQRERNRETVEKMKLLGWWLMLVGTLRLASVWFGFFDIWALRVAAHPLYGCCCSGIHINRSKVNMCRVISSIE